MVYKTLKEKDMMRRWIIITASVLLLGGCALVAPPPQEPVEPPAIEPQNNSPIISSVIAESRVSPLSKNQIVCEAENSIEGCTYFPDAGILRFSK